MRTTALVIILFLCRSLSLAGERDEAKYSDEAEQTAGQLAGRIRTEVATLPSHPWAGEYGRGDGWTSAWLLLAPKAGYVFELRGCDGVCDRNYGGLTYSNGRVRLSFAFANERQRGFPEELIPIAWGQRSYLVPSDGVIGFCNHVNDGTEPRHGKNGSDLLRKGDENIPATGLPTVPERYRAYLLAKPIVAEIVGIGSVTTRPSLSDWEFKDTTVILNAGKDKGLLPGMSMHVVQPADRIESVRITKVEDDTSEAFVSQREGESPPTKGWQLSTRYRPNTEREHESTKSLVP